MNSFIALAPIVALLFFFFVFVWILLRAYRPKLKEKLQAHALIPLQEETND